MILRLHPNSGDVIGATYDSHVSMMEVEAWPSVYEIDEVLPENRSLMADIKAMIGKRDKFDKVKYYVQDGVLYERDGWVIEGTEE